MTETPRTDALIAPFAGKADMSQFVGQWNQLLIHARELERDLIATQKEIERLTSCLHTANSNHEEFERKYYLELDRTEQALALRGEPQNHEQAALALDMCVQRIQKICDLFGLDPAQWLADHLEEPALRGEPVAMWGITANRVLFDAGLREVSMRERADKLNSKKDGYLYDVLPLYAAPISGERAIPAGHCTLFVPHSSACAQQAQCLAVSGERVREALTDDLIEAVYRMRLVPRGHPIPLPFLQIAQEWHKAFALPLAAQPEHKPMPTNWGDRVSYLTDDRDHDERFELSIMPGGNGDWYVSVMPEGHRLGPSVRLSTSGGAARAAPGLGVAISQAYRALLAAQPEGKS